MKWEDTKVLITGATGSFGKNLVRKLLDKYHPAVIRIFSRDELKQYEMRGNGYDHKSLRYFIGAIYGHIHCPAFHIVLIHPC